MTVLTLLAKSGFKPFHLTLRSKIMRTLFKNPLRWLFIVAALSLIVVIGCKEDNPAKPEPVNPQELITKVMLTLTPAGGGAAVTVTFNDPDGDGGNAPTIGTLTLKAGTTYNGTIELLDETKSPADTITAEVEEESDAHQFFYTPEGGIVGRVTVTILDMDSKNLPVGLQYRVAVSAGAAVSGSLNVVLSHYDAKPKDGVNRSDESDIDIDFPVNVTQ
jgi:hypothetical protein